MARSWHTAAPRVDVLTDDETGEVVGGYDKNLVDGLCRAYIVTRALGQEPVRCNLGEYLNEAYARAIVERTVLSNEFAPPPKVDSEKVAEAL